MTKFRGSEVFASALLVAIVATFPFLSWQRQVESQLTAIIILLAVIVGRLGPRDPS